MSGDMRCRVCGWWPPLVRVRHGATEQASEPWRWRKLRYHVAEQALVEYEDGRPDGEHIALDDELDAIHEANP